MSKKRSWCYCCWAELISGILYLCHGQDQIQSVHLMFVHQNRYCEGRGEEHSKKAKAKLISHVYWVLGNCFVFYHTNCNLCDNTHIRYILRTARTKGVVFTFCQTVCNPCDNTYSISLCICLGSWEEQRQRMWCRSPPGGERERESECDLIAICLLQWKSKDKRLLAFLSLNKSAEADLRGD